MSSGSSNQNNKESSRNSNENQERRKKPELLEQFRGFRYDQNQNRNSEEIQNSFIPPENQEESIAIKVNMGVYSNQNDRIQHITKPNTKVSPPVRQGIRWKTLNPSSENGDDSNFPENGHHDRNPNPFSFKHNRHAYSHGSNQDYVASDISPSVINTEKSKSKTSEFDYPKFFNRMFMAVQIFFIIRSIITITAINTLNLTWANSALVAYLSIINGIFMAMSILAIVLFLISGKRDLLFNYVFLFVDSFFLILVLFGMNYYSETEFWSIVFHRSSGRTHEVVMFYVKHILLFFPVFLIQFGASFMHTVVVTEIKII